MTRRARAASEGRAVVAASERAATTVPAASIVPAAPGDAGVTGAHSVIDVAELWAAIHLRSLVLDALRPTGAMTSCDASKPPPLAAVEAQAGVQRVVAVDRAARERGVMTGAGLAAALALCPDLDARPRALRRERRLLLRLAETALAFTPRVSLEPPDAVLLEVRGSLGLFGGADALIRRLHERCSTLGVDARLALAPTPGAALALARLSPAVTPGAAGPAVPTVTGGERLVSLLAPLPLTALRWPPVRLERLASMGVKTIGEVLRLPRAGFARRFGRDALLALDRLVGRAPEPRRAFAAREWFRGRCEPSWELSDHDAVLRHVRPLLEDLECYLRRRQRAIAELQLHLLHRPSAIGSGAAVTPIPLRLAAPEFRASAFAGLLGEHLARVELSAAVVRIELRSGELQALESGTDSLWRPGEHGGAVGRESTTLIERLRARLGADAVYGLCLVPEHRPESAWRVAEPGTMRAAAVTAQAAPAVSGVTVAAGAHPRRPLWLLRWPEALERGLAGLTLLEGPERIETGWWDGYDVMRDYYVARDAEGARLWVFRERVPPHGWFLQGVFG